MSQQCVHPLIVTDLDGTLLDHHSYSARPADALIKQLIDTSIADIIPITSKTQAELHWLEKDVPLSDCVKISENGSVIQVPAGHFLYDHNTAGRTVLGVPYQVILAAIKALSHHLSRSVHGFSAMTALEVSRHTGLDLYAAQRAKERQATEPFLWSGTTAELHELRELMLQADIQIQQGGRFYHFTGKATKLQAMQHIADAFKRQKPDKKYVTIALGDGPNDLGMLEVADFGVIIPNTDGTSIQSNVSSVRTADKSGPHGWVSSVTVILHELGLL